MERSAVVIEALFTGFLFWRKTDITGCPGISNQRIIHDFLVREMITRDCPEMIRMKSSHAVSAL